ncbi:HAD family hydrolase [Streptomyces sp. VRA16 Mangrove soil]|nr:HAD family hydrolase [Streptomyces sp. VRA16 Mangrove soil]
MGETLVRDDRYRGRWADRLGVPRHTLAALVGAMVAGNRDNSDALRLVRPGTGIDAEYRAREAAGRGEVIEEQDLHADVRPTLAGLRERGPRVVVAGSQTVRAGVLPRALGLPADVVATSDEGGVSHPSPAFFARLPDVLGAAPEETVYVGDHPADDVFPAKRAGLRVAHLRRDAWGHLRAADPDVVAAADRRIDTLEQLVPLLTRGCPGTRTLPGERNRGVRHLTPGPVSVGRTRLIG